MNKFSILVAICAFSILASCQTPEHREILANGYFPAEMKDNVWLNLADFREPNLFRDSDTAFQSRYRLSISGISCTMYVIRIDERVGGALTGKVSQRNKCRSEPTQSRMFRPSVEDLAELKTLIDAANMFKFYPEVWTSEGEDEICLDGNMLVFERRTKDGYAVSSANAQCDAPQRLHAVAQQFVKMSGVKEASGLLR